jgi:hypothetical protein
LKTSHIVRSARTPITAIASGINALADRPSASEAGIWLVKVCVVVYRVSEAMEDVIVFGIGINPVRE